MMKLRQYLGAALASLSVYATAQDKTIIDIGYGGEHISDIYITNVIDAVNENIAPYNAALEISELQNSLHITKEPYQYVGAYLSNSFLKPHDIIIAKTHKNFQTTNNVVSPRTMGVENTDYTHIVDYVNNVLFFDDDLSFEQQVEVITQEIPKLLVNNDEIVHKTYPSEETNELSDIVYEHINKHLEKSRETKYTIDYKHNVDLKRELTYTLALNRIGAIKPKEIVDSLSTLVKEKFNIELHEKSIAFTDYTSEQTLDSINYDIRKKHDSDLVFVFSIKDWKKDNITQKLVYAKDSEFLQGIGGQAYADKGIFLVDFHVNNPFQVTVHEFLHLFGMVHSYNTRFHSHTVALDTDRIISPNTYEQVTSNKDKIFLKPEYEQE